MEIKLEKNMYNFLLYCLKCPDLELLQDALWQDFGWSYTLSDLTGMISDLQEEIMDSHSREVNEND